MSPEWQAAWVKAKAAVAKLSVTDKVNLATGSCLPYIISSCLSVHSLLAGVQWEKGPCVGNTAAISSIGFPGLCLQDGPLGVRFADLVSVFPAYVSPLMPLY